MVGFQNFLVVTEYYTRHIRQASVTELNGVPVDYFVESISLKEVFVLLVKNTYPIFVEMCSLYGGLNQTMFLFLFFRSDMHSPNFEAV